MALETLMHPRIVTLTLCTLLIGAGSANASSFVLDTYPSGPATGSIGIYASYQWQEAAIPFHLSQPGFVTEIDAAIFFTNSPGPIPQNWPILVGIAAGNLVGTSGALKSLFQESICPAVPGDCQFHPGPQRPVILAPGQPFSWTGRLFLNPGDYWLYASMYGDDVPVTGRRMQVCSPTTGRREVAHWVSPKAWVASSPPQNGLPWPNTGLRPARVEPMPLPLPTFNLILSRNLPPSSCSAAGSEFLRHGEDEQRRNR
jgi:hypothetical protein